ncbi:MAG: hypothetical protein WDM90_24610 [Ferruginibacter sp.]
MRKAIILFVLSFTSLFSFAQAPSLEGHVISAISTVEFWYGDCGLNLFCYQKKDKVKAEVPPCVIGNTQHTYFMVDGNNTYAWSSAKSLTGYNKIDFKDDATGPVMVSSPSATSGNDWKRNYHSIYSAQTINDLCKAQLYWAFFMEKIKMSAIPVHRAIFKIPLILMQQFNCNDHLTWSGGNPYQDGWLAYHAMVSVAWAPYTKATNFGQQYFSNQLGPVSWPANGFISIDNTIATTGHSHPSSIIANGYLYIFYTDAGPYGNHIALEEGRLKGVKVVRVKQAEVLDASKYEIFYKNTNGKSEWHASLPAGFTKENMLSYTKVKGPKSSDILNSDESSRAIRFSVAKIKNADYFIGVEEYLDLTASCTHNGGPVYRVALRFSEDLISWSERKLQVTPPKCFDEHNMRYPIFLDKTVVPIPKLIWMIFIYWEQAE